MAKVTTAKKELVITLELSEAEAQYVHGALWLTSPRDLDEDTVWNALDAALTDADVRTSSDYAVRG